MDVWSSIDNPESWGWKVSNTFQLSGETSKYLTCIRLQVSNKRAQIKGSKSPVGFMHVTLFYYQRDNYILTNCFQTRLKNEKDKNQG